MGARLTNILLRLLTMLSRFALIFFLARYFQPAALGLFGLMSATIGFAALTLGGDYYTYSQRELIASPLNRWSFVLQHHIIALAFLYTLLLPLQILIFHFHLLPTSMLWWYFPILIIENLSQESSRFLIAMGMPVRASVTAFTRTGLWVWTLIPTMLVHPDLRHLNIIFGAWLAGGLLSLLIAAQSFLHKLGKPQRHTLDINWIKKGFKVGMMFLFATFCFKGLTTVDRYAFKSLSGYTLLGVYVFYLGLSMSIMNFLDAAVFSFTYPRLVSAHRMRNGMAYSKSLREMTISTLVLTIVLALCILIVEPTVAAWTGRTLYMEHTHLLWILLGAAFAYAASMIPHFALYARNADRGIFFAHVSSIFIFFITVFGVARSISRLYAPAVGLLVAFIWLGLFKLLWYMRTDRIQNFD